MHNSFENSFDLFVRLRVNIRPWVGTLLGVGALLAVASVPANARGVSPYLPLHQSPEIERKIEQVLILGGQPVLARPIAAGTVIDALPAACKVAPALCNEVRHYLKGLEKSYGVSRLDVSISATSADATLALPNRHGSPANSNYNLSGQIYWQPGNHFLASAGVVAYEGDSTPTGTLVSLGIAKAQLDIGYRDHWLSPMTDSAMLLSTEAATMPSITLSNYVPMTRFGLRYEVFMAGMSESDRIVYDGALTTGRPRLAGMHLSIEPYPGWSIGVSRIMQYGGGQRSSSLGDLFKAFFRPSEFDNFASPSDTEFGNQAAAITSSFIMPTPIPFAVYFEYAGEDTSTNSNFRLGNSAFSAGIHFPNLAGRFDLTIEASDWQNGWYVHHIYRDGMTNEGNVIGHWGAGTGFRVAGDGVGAHSLMTRLGWQLPGGALVETTYRSLDNDAYTAPAYQRAQSLQLRYSRRWGEDFYIGGQFDVGRDSFGENYSRLTAFLRF